MGLSANHSYERKFEENYKFHNDVGAGKGDYSEIGLVELQILINSGLTNKSFLMDFGCGLGGLATFAVDFLDNGNYLGTEISNNAIEKARQRLQNSSKHFNLILHEALNLLPIQEFIKNTKKIDIICAFSVFTHLANDDSYNILLQLKNVMHENSTLVASFIEFNNDYSRKIFTEESAISYQQRDLRIRNVVSSKETVLSIFSLAGFKNIDWFKPSHNFKINSILARKYSVKEELSLGQSVGIFKKN